MDQPNNRWVTKDPRRVGRKGWVGLDKRARTETSQRARRLFDVNHMLPNIADGYASSSNVTFGNFEQLTSVPVNSTNDQFLTCGYSKHVALYDIDSGKCLQLFNDMHRGPINVAKFAHHSPSVFFTSAIDQDDKMWDLWQQPLQPCYTGSSSNGNVMVCFSPDDHYLLVSVVDNEVLLLKLDMRYSFLV
ncbi:hypothetical protein HYC85_002400 [Camellia sinensis]|uniref:Uncharacterized protein n=1 Tax=Camellia sinensis TaxID=4442 RepID=A0A7J7I9F1_CAMSI|nr:hypothetical protein HYC85_002400 [Camellia sinensis]